MNDGHLIDALGDALYKRYGGIEFSNAIERPCFRLIQYVNLGFKGRWRPGSTHLHPLISIEWRRRPYSPSWYVRDYHELSLCVSDRLVYPAWT